MTSRPVYLPYTAINISKLFTWYGTIPDNDYFHSSFNNIITMTQNMSVRCINTYQTQVVLADQNSLLGRGSHHLCQQTDHVSQIPRQRLWCEAVITLGYFSSNLQHFYSDLSEQFCSPRGLGRCWSKIRSQMTFYVNC